MLFLLFLACIGGKYDSYVEEATQNVDDYCSQTCHPDGDDDGYGSSTTSYGCCTINAREFNAKSGHNVTVRPGDCDDGDASVHPDQFDVSGDGVDSNCNGDPNK